MREQIDTLVWRSQHMMALSFAYGTISMSGLPLLQFVQQQPQGKQHLGPDRAGVTTLESKNKFEIGSIEQQQKQLD